MKKTKFGYFLYIVIGLILFNIVWFLLAVFINIKALPNPTDVYSAYHEAFNNNILSHFTASLQRVTIGLGISAFIGLTLGLLMGYNKTINRFIGPLLYFSYPIPKLALLPIIMVLFGIGETSKILIIVLIIVFQLIISIRDAVLAIPKEDYAVLISLRANHLNMIKHITIPAILPAFLSSLRVSVGIAVSALFFTETFGTDKGLGFYITDSWMRIDYIQMYFGIILLSLAGFILFIIFDLIEKYACKWKNI